MKYILNFIFSFYCCFTFAQNLNFDPNLTLSEEFRYFMNEGAYTGQEQFFPSYSITPELTLNWGESNNQLVFKGFFRHDKDSRRTHVDAREFYIQKSKGKWDLSIGYQQIYWGVAESNHLVDIINQNDAVEDAFGNTKLGQPLIKYTLATNKFGTFNLIYLPIHRKLLFPGEKGRFRFPFVLDEDFINYEKNSGTLKKDFAMRWNHYFGILDIGINHFYGNGREPFFNLGSLTPSAFYPIINQTGLDLQLTIDAVLLKFEGIYRSSNFQNFFANVSGLEYTFSNINGAGLDIGIVAEYSYDDRGNLSVNSLQNDIFSGIRIDWNDMNGSNILFGVLSDLQYNTESISIDATRRIKENYRISIEGLYFINIDSEELLLPFFSQDHYVKLEISQFF